MPPGFQVGTARASFVHSKSRPLFLLLYSPITPSLSHHVLVFTFLPFLAAVDMQA